MNKKAYISLVIVGVAILAAWPVKVGCGRKGYTCLSGPRSDGRVCHSVSTKPNFSKLFDLGIEYTRNKVCS